MKNENVEFFERTLMEASETQRLSSCVSMVRRWPGGWVCVGKFVSVVVLVNVRWRVEGGFE